MAAEKDSMDKTEFDGLPLWGITEEIPFRS